MKKTLLIFCVFYIFNFQLSISNCNAQSDSVQTKLHSPKKATLLALVPGAGQIYNKKYWKLPIVYGGLGASSFLIYYYADNTATYRKEYVARVNGEPKETLNPDLADKTLESILLERNRYRRNMEISVAACAIVYALSILDACVDAHLYYYDVSDNLSLGIKPKFDYNPVTKSTTPCLALVIKF
ncbi:MAG: DUF5683 domain-containing protein [Bacteroidetes bacterium]|nr:DUF5683 domain-containing protein [Bacteroidota bacterium]MCL1968364.1 DUF5683 domain-containing protein [Bacteroidota bacterium]